MNLRQIDMRQGIAWVQGKRGWRKVFLGKASVQAIQAYLRERPVGKGDALWLNRFSQSADHRRRAPTGGSAGGEGQY